LWSYGSEENKYYTWDKVLWHPEGIDESARAGTTKIKKEQRGAASAPTATSLGQISTSCYKDELHRAGGKLPAAGSWSGAGPVAATLDPSNNYTQAKEVSTFVRRPRMGNAEGMSL
jgi:hypothetical protein